MDWLVTMYSLFGNKWAKLHRGPMWEGDIIKQRAMEDETDLTSGTANVGKNVCVHVEHFSELCYFFVAIYYRLG